MAQSLAYFPERATLPNLTRAEFVAQVNATCRRVGVAQLADFDATCRALAIELFCQELPCRTLAIYLSSACNVQFKGE
jgi:hypothetical protein